MIRNKIKTKISLILSLKKKIVEANEILLTFDSLFWIAWPKVLSLKPQLYFSSISNFLDRNFTLSISFYKHNWRLFQDILNEQQLYCRFHVPCLENRWVWIYHPTITLNKSQQYLFEWDNKVKMCLNVTSYCSLKCLDSSLFFPWYQIHTKITC